MFQCSCSQGNAAAASSVVHVEGVDGIALSQEQVVSNLYGPAFLCAEGLEHQLRGLGGPALARVVDVVECAEMLADSLAGITGLAAAQVGQRRALARHAAPADSRRPERRCCPCGRRCAHSDHDEPERGGWGRVAAMVRTYQPTATGRSGRADAEDRRPNNTFHCQVTFALILGRVVSVRFAGPESALNTHRTRAHDAVSASGSVVSASHQESGDGA